MLGVSEQADAGHYAEDDTYGAYSNSYGEKYEPEEPTEDTYGADMRAGGGAEDYGAGGMDDYDTRQPTHGEQMGMRNAAPHRGGAYGMSAAGAGGGQGREAGVGRPGIMGPNPRTVPRPFAPSRQMRGAFGGGGGGGGGAGGGGGGGGGY